MQEADQELQRAIDQALARAYGQRGSGDRAGVPPAPHLMARALEHLHLGGATEFPFQTEAGPTQWSPPPTLQWQATIRTLERKYHDRFAKMADILIEARDRQHMKVLLFTSCHRAEGRTTLVLTLARALARRPGRTLLVDADLTGPMIARCLGIRPVVGLDDVVNDGVALTDAVIEAPDDNLSVLPLRAPVGHPRDFLASPAWACTMARLRREYDLVLLDGSPLFAGLSAAVMHRSVDGAVLVHSQLLTGERNLLRAREVLDAGGIPLLGTAETFV
jgi:protein-tyrosine kinase